MRRYSEIEHLFNLNLAVYRVVELFPEAEPLRSKIRESANKVLADLLLSNEYIENGSRCIKEILELFDLAERKNLVDSRNFLVLRREYDKIRQSFGRGLPVVEAGKNSGKSVENSLLTNGHNNHRQERILEVMNGNGMVKIGDLIKLFPGVNRRTVLRDLDKLCQVGVAVRNGNGRGAHYVKSGLNHDMS